MTTFTIDYLDGRQVSVQQSSLPLLHQIPSPPPSGDFTHYMHLTSSGLARVANVTATLGPQDTTATLVLSSASGALVDQRAELEVVSADAGPNSLMWTTDGTTLRLDLALAPSTTQSFLLHDPTSPPVALRVVVIRP